MVFTAEYGEELVKKLKKLKKRDVKRYEIILKKRDEILLDPARYKNLRYDLSDRKRVHIDSHFVLTFHYIASEDLIILYAFDHYDKIF